MKRIFTLLVIAALGAATLSCSDGNYDDVAQTVEDAESTDLNESDERVIAVPGQD